MSKILNLKTLLISFLTLAVFGVVAVVAVIYFNKLADAQSAVLYQETFDAYPDGADLSAQGWVTETTNFFTGAVMANPGWSVGTWNGDKVFRPNVNDNKNRAVYTGASFGDSVQTSEVYYGYTYGWFRDFRRSADGLNYYRVNVANFGQNMNVEKVVNGVSQGLAFRNTRSFFQDFTPIQKLVIQDNLNSQGSVNVIFDALGKTTSLLVKDANPLPVGFIGMGQTFSAFWSSFIVTSPELYKAAQPYDLTTLGPLNIHFQPAELSLRNFEMFPPNLDAFSRQFAGCCGFSGVQQNQPSGRGRSWITSTINGNFLNWGDSNQSLGEDLTIPGNSQGGYSASFDIAGGSFETSAGLGLPVQFAVQDSTNSNSYQATFHNGVFSPFTGLLTLYKVTNGTLTALASKDGVFTTTVPAKTHLEVKVENGLVSASWKTPNGLDGATISANDTTYTSVPAGGNLLFIKKDKGEGILLFSGNTISIVPLAPPPPAADNDNIADTVDPQPGVFSNDGVKGTAKWTVTSRSNLGNVDVVKAHPTGANTLRIELAAVGADGLTSQKLSGFKCADNTTTFDITGPATLDVTCPGDLAVTLGNDLATFLTRGFRSETTAKATGPGNLISIQSGTSQDSVIIPLAGAVSMSCTSGLGATDDKCFAGRKEMTSVVNNQLATAPEPVNVKLVNSSGVTTVMTSGLTQTAAFNSLTIDGTPVTGQSNALILAPTGTKWDGNGIENKACGPQTLAQGAVNIIKRYFGGGVQSCSPLASILNQNLIFDSASKVVSDTGILDAQGSVKIEVRRDNASGELLGSVTVPTTSISPFTYTASINISTANPFPTTIYVSKTPLNPENAAGPVKTHTLSTSQTSATGGTSATLPTGQSASTQGGSGVTLTTSPAGEPQATVQQCTAQVVVEFILSQAQNSALCGSGNSCAIFRNGTQLTTNVTVNPDGSRKYTATDTNCVAGVVYTLKALDTTPPSVAINSAVWTGLFGSVSFTATDNLKLASVKVNFGDGSPEATVTLIGTSANGSASHTYSAGGTYTITVTPADAAGNIGTPKTIIVQIPSNSSLTTSTDPTTGVVTVKDPSGNILTILPAGTLTASTWNVDVTPGLAGGAIKVNGVTLPTGTTKSVSFPDTNASAKFVCIVDGPADADVQQLQNGSCVTLGFQVKMNCPAPGPTTKTFTGSDNITRNFECDRSGGRVNLKGLVHSVVTQWADADEDGIPDSQDACPTTVGISAYQGCPNAIQDNDSLHVHYHKVKDPGLSFGGFACTDSLGKQKPNCKLPLKLGPIGDSRGESVTFAHKKIFKLSDLGATSFGQIKDQCKAIYDGTFPVGGAPVVNEKDEVTSTEILGVPGAGNYVVIKRVHITDPTAGTFGTTVCKPVDPGDFVNGVANRVLKVIKTVKPGGIQLSPADDTTFTGSLLTVTYPTDAMWDATVNNYVYPYIFTSDSSWTTNVCASVPTGYTISGVYDELGNLVASTNCAQTFVAGETKVLAFEALKVGSPKKFKVGFDVTASQKGKPPKKVHIDTDSEIVSPEELKIDKTKGKIEAGGSLWSLVARYLDGSFHIDIIKEAVRKVAEYNHINIPEWGLNGGNRDANRLQVGLVIDLLPLEKYLK